MLLLLLCHFVHLFQNPSIWDWKLLKGRLCFWKPCSTQYHLECRDTHWLYVKFMTVNISFKTLGSGPSTEYVPMRFQWLDEAGLTVRCAVPCPAAAPLPSVYSPILPSSFTTSFLLDFLFFFYSYETYVVEYHDASPVGSVMRSRVWLWSTRNQRNCRGLEAQPWPLESPQHNEQIELP